MRRVVEHTNGDVDRSTRTREALRSAALDLFERHGYDAVTGAQIAAAVGVTERTFFRHFTTKIGVLMGGSDESVEFFAETFRGQPADLDPLQAILATIQAEGEAFPPSTDDLRRLRIVMSTASLAGEVRSFEEMIETVFAQLIAERTGRTATDYEVRIVASVLVAVRRSVFREWARADGRPELAELAERALASLTVDL